MKNLDNNKLLESYITKTNNNRINSTINKIKEIDNQIIGFKELKPLFFEIKKIKKYNERIKNLEDLKHSLYKQLEKQIDNILNIENN